MADDDIDNLDFLPQELMGGGGPSSAAAAQGGMPDWAQLMGGAGGMMGGPGGMMGGMMGGMGLAALADPRIKDGTASRWVCVYPVYFDQDKSWEEGRRVPKAAAVKDPAAVYIHRAVEMLGLEAAVEPARRHPRDAFTFGRIRVQLRTSDGRALNSTCTTKKQLLLRIASLLPAVVVALDADGPHHAETAATSRSVVPQRAIDAALSTGGKPGHASASASGSGSAGGALALEGAGAAAKKKAAKKGRK